MGTFTRNSRFQWQNMWAIYIWKEAVGLAKCIQHCNKLENGGQFQSVAYH